MRGPRLLLRYPLAALALALAAWAAFEATDWTWPFATAYRLAPGEIQAAGGRAYSVRMPADVDPARLRLYEGTPRARQPLGFLDGLLWWSRVYYYLNGVIAKRFPGLATGISWTAIGPAGQRHEEIQRLGGGRFAATQDVLVFSAPDSSDVRANSRAYRIEVNPAVPGWVRAGVKAAALLLALACAVLVVQRVPWLRSQTPGIVIAAVMLALLFAAGEAYLRVKVPFLQNAWPGQTHPVAGFILQPGGELRHTNHADFWIREKANSLGFLDREPAIPKPPGTFRILVLGDSFVEAAQVSIPKKFHVLLEQRLRRDFPQLKVDVVAMGYSGTGQAAQLAFYEAFGRKLQPDLVLIIVVANDFANNSPVLESVRHGWHPYHPPRLFFEVDSEPPVFRRIEVDMKWDKHLIHAATADNARDLAARIDILRRDPAIARRLEGWGYPDDLDMDVMFCAEDVPPAFDQAIALTGHIFRKFAELGSRDGFKVIAVATDGLTQYCKRTIKPRRLRPGGLVGLLRDALPPAGIELWDLHPAFEAKGDRKPATFRFDAHWSETGHEWVAEALAEHFRRQPGTLSK